MAELHFGSEEEKFAFLDRLHHGDPVAWGRLVIMEHKQEIERQGEGELYEQEKGQRKSRKGCDIP